MNKLFSGKIVVLALLLVGNVSVHANDAKQTLAERLGLEEHVLDKLGTKFPGVPYRLGVYSDAIYDIGERLDKLEENENVLARLDALEKQAKSSLVGDVWNFFWAGNRKYFTGTVVTVAASYAVYKFIYRNAKTKKNRQSEEDDEDADDFSAE